jgi:cytochrome c oxidase cbb3-type subunit 2
MGVYSKPIAFAVLSAVVILIGTIVVMVVPMFLPSTQPSSAYVTPYTAIELEGRDIYIREGCNNCHTQTVRPLRTEVARYGDYSKPEEFTYDRPFLWGSRRTGPDLNRVGGKYPDSWHYLHMDDPQSMFSKSNMPKYGWLAKRKLDTRYSFKKTSILGFGYSEDEVRRQIDDYRAMVSSEGYGSKGARDSVTPAGLREELTEMDAMVAYLQKLGRDVKALKQKEMAGGM